MYLEKQKVHGNVYLRLVNNTVKQNKNGELKPTREIVKNLGKLSDLDDGQPNFLERLRKSFKDGNPILPELQPYVDGTARPVTVIEFVEGADDCRLRRYMFAGDFLSLFMKELALTTLLTQIKSKSRIQYDLVGIVKLLVYGRLMNPQSKIATASQNQMYFVPPVPPDTFHDKDVYKAMDVLYEQHDRILRTIHRRLMEKTGRDTTVVFYDVTNAFFQIDNPDEDIEDEDGVCAKKGLRKRGKSKEGRHDSIVQVALFMDSKGLPLSVNVFPGNMPDVSTLRPMLENMLRVAELGKFLFVADRGICSKANCFMLTQQNAGYVLSKSILKSSKKVQDWILDDQDWTNVTPDFRYKSKIVKEKVKDDDGTEHELQEKVIVYWSKKYCEKERADHKKLVEFLHSMEDDTGGVPIECVQKAYVKKNFKKAVAVTTEDGKLTGKTISKSRLREIIDTEKLKRDIELFGYYQIITSEIETPDLKVIQTYKKLVKIETEFHDMKDVLDLRPMYVRTPEHIQAHVLLCFIGLTIMRLMQIRIVEATPELQKDALLWTWGLSGDRLRAALNNWQVAQLPQGYYVFTQQGGTAADKRVNADLETLLHAYDIEIPFEVFTKGELLRIMRGISIFR